MLELAVFLLTFGAGMILFPLLARMSSGDANLNPADDRHRGLPGAGAARQAARLYRVYIPIGCVSFAAGAILLIVA